MFFINLVLKYKYQLGCLKVRAQWWLLCMFCPFLPTQHIYVLCLILTINTGYISEQHYPVFFYQGALCSLWDRNWSFIYSFR